MRVLLVAVVILTGCATDRPTGAPPPSKVEVPVMVSCIPVGLPAEPVAATDAELLKMTPRARYLRIAADREAAIAWQAKIAPALAACR